MKDRKLFYLNYDLDATTYKYGKITAPAGGFQGFGGVKTTGTSTTIDAVTAGQKPFAPVLVGDYILFYIGETPTTRRRVVTKPSDDQITISGAGVTLGAGIASWYFFPFRIGATDEDGGHSVEGYETAFLELDFATIIAGGGVDVSAEIRGRSPASKWNVFFTKNYPVGTPIRDVIEINKKDAAGGISAGGWPELIGSVRVGLKGGTDFVGTDDLSVFLTGSPRW